MLAGGRLRLAARVPALKGGRLLSSKPGFYELRTDHVNPGSLSKYLDEVERSAADRRRVLPGWKGIWKTELGGNASTVRHLYRWSDYDERDAARAQASDDAAFFGAVSKVETKAGMTLPLPSLRESLSSTHSMVMVEASACLHACGLPGADGFTPPPPPPPSDPAGDVVAPVVAYELRTYQLVLGYSTVPKFLALYQEGLADKLAADATGASSLVTLLYSDCGPLNTVMELWRHESLERSQASRQASRAAPKWRAAIEQIAELSVSFDTQFMRPLPCSPWR